MAEICCGMVGKDNESSTPGESRPSRKGMQRRRMDIRRIKFVSGLDKPENGVDSVNRGVKKRQKLEVVTSSFSLENCNDEESVRETQTILMLSSGPVVEICPKYGVASVCGRRRDMEDAVAVHPSLTAAELHFFGVYDGHGCSHVATKCRERLHELVKEELERNETLSSSMSPKWKEAMERSFRRMDKEVIVSNQGTVDVGNCRCELQAPACDAVGSTAVVAIVTPHKLIVANCGDSRAVLCRNGKPVPLSSDHKPDRPDELNRIKEAGGRVIYWEGPRVLGVLAMSRAIGDNYLKPFVSCEPEVTVTDRTPEDDCLILASDGLWDVVSNDTACGVARMCLRGKAGKLSCCLSENKAASGGGSGGWRQMLSDRACSDASMLLTKLALSRHTSDNVSVVVVDLRTRTS